MRMSSPRATSRPFEVSSTGAAMTVQLDDVTRLEVGQAIECEINASQLDGEGDRDIEWSNLGSGHGGGIGSGA